MSAGRILTYRTQALADLKALFPLLKDIDTHAGRFDDEEIGRLIMKAPALRLAYLGSPKTDENQDGRLGCLAKFGVFIVTKDGEPMKRDAQALNIAEALLVAFDRYQPKVGGKTLSEAARNLRHDILYTSDTDKKGVLLTAVSWETKITIGASFIMEGGAVLNELYINGELVLEVAP
ncbi:hypothetical protein [Taklimakanibacter albus]|uniref:Uncharacterized protein n=1 Tax=Taklimakanibacter albus TaxID=2800327 RepID=A0ACC5R6K0_9HYPH|nr:hypothetical protein [Aestuariivirga sp. YIM B02566]MBK1868257.1 hypothetical protein [Aestuariivirga sp. YIM B02566]